ncbi:hypothetical protein HYX17_04565 [Candidatus Woesearchaeota archaeon]|nr:hypothetical protein [Candidatus Woesearchaeota archaeon]
MLVEDKNNRKKQEDKEELEETIDDLVDEEFNDISQGDVVIRVSTEPTILSEETEEKTIQKPQRDILRSPESELEETASEAPLTRREKIEYEITSPLNPITRKEDNKPDLKYHPEKLYEPKYQPDEIGRKKEDKKEEKVYTTKREIIS